jgi:hypothetical protein
MWDVIGQTRKPTTSAFWNWGQLSFLIFHFLFGFLFVVFFFFSGKILPRIFSKFFSNYNWIKIIYSKFHRVFWDIHNICPLLGSLAIIMPS